MNGFDAFVIETLGGLARRWELPNVESSDSAFAASAAFSAADVAGSPRVHTLPALACWRSCCCRDCPAVARA